VTGDPVRRRWVLAWLGGPVLGVTNGVLRDRLYGPRLGEDRAHQVSTFPLVAGLLAHAAVVERWAPLPDRRTAVQVGAVWAGLTVAFESVFGHWLSPARTPWRELVRAYDLPHGQTWALVPLTMAVAPELVRSRRR
jgi:hypothetical protein